MKLRSIPPRTCITLARERKFTPVVRKLSLSKSFDVIGKRGRMRQQISQKPFANKLSQLQDELAELTEFAGEGFDVSKLEKEIRSQIERLSLFLGGEQK